MLLFCFQQSKKAPKSSKQQSPLSQTLFETHVLAALSGEVASFCCKALEFDSKLPINCLKGQKLFQSVACALHIYWRLPNRRWFMEDISLRSARQLLWPSILMRKMFTKWLLALFVNWNKRKNVHWKTPTEMYLMWDDVLEIYSMGSWLDLRSNLYLVYFIVHAGVEPFKARLILS